MQPGGRALGRVAARAQQERRVHAVEKRLPGCLVAGHRRGEPDQVIGIRDAIRTQAVQHGEGRRTLAAQPLGLCRPEQLRQRLEDRARMVRIVALERERSRPVAGYPVRRRPEEPERRVRAGDAAAAQAVAVPPDVAALGVRPQEALRAAPHARIVGIGLQEAERFVQRTDFAGRAQPCARESCHPFELARGQAVAVTARDARESGCQPAAPSPHGSILAGALR